MLGIGSTDRSWTKLKKLLSVNQFGTETNVIKKQATIAATHTKENNKQDCAEKAKTIFLWGDQYFSTLKMDALRLPLDVTPSDEVQWGKFWVFHAWIET